MNTLLSMMDFGGTSFSLVLTLAFLIVFMALKTIHQRSKLPPGPIPIPFLGNVLQVDGENPVQSMKKIYQTYGPVFTLHFGSKPILVLYGYKAVKEALVDQADDFSGRGDLPLLHLVSKGYGIIMSNGERWKQLRRFSLITLRNFGMGKRSIEERIQEEAHFLVQELRKTKESAFNPTFYFNKAVSNVICSIVFGSRFDYEDIKFLSLLQILFDNVRFMSSAWGQLYNRFPRIIRLLPGPHNKFRQNMKVARRYMKEYIKEHQDTLDSSNPRDFIDCFLLKMQQEKQNPSSEFSMKNLVATTLDLFGAGTETVSTTLRYGFLIFLKYPDVEEKIHHEIDQVIGRSRPPCMDDRNKMPYTDAVIHEIQRFIDIIPLNLPHSVIQDTTFRGYTIPKGMDVIPVLFSVHYDEKMFGSPEVFDPNHFLDVNGCFKRNDGFVPFSTGKRICPGEGLARMELFLFFITILQNFTLKASENPNNIDLTPEMSGFANVPRPYQLQLLPR